MTGLTCKSRTTRTLLLGAALLVLAGCADLLRNAQPYEKPVGTIEGFEQIRYHMMDINGPTSPDLTEAYAKETPDNYVIEADGQPVYNYSRCPAAARPVRSAPASSTAGPRKAAAPGSRSSPASAPALSSHPSHSSGRTMTTS